MSRRVRGSSSSISLAISAMKLLYKLVSHYRLHAMRILVIEDDATVAGFLKRRLGEDGHVVDHAANGPDGVRLADENDHEVMIIDRMLPGVDGLRVIQTVRDNGNQTPVLILSALGEVDDRVQGLKAGGDDYLVKPFAYSELMARVESLVRRFSSQEEQISLEVADLKMDLLSRDVSRDNQPIDLKPREFLLLECLMRHAGQVLTRTMLLEAVWDYHFDPQTNVIDVHISRLRQKVDRGFSQALIHTIRGAGYVLRAPQ
jgi:two-component system OmpR family response regulator